VGAGVERQDLQGHVGQLAGLQEPLQLAAHDLGAAHRAAQGGLVDHRPQPRRLLAGEQHLAGHPQPHPPADLLAGVVEVGAADEGAHVVVGLEQAGDELALVGADQAGRRLQVHVRPEPRRQQVAVVLPPAGVVGVGGHGQELLDLVGVGDLVPAQQVDQVAPLEADLAVLEAVDLPFRGPDGLGRLGP
jgi:hypothetical protein